MISLRKLAFIGLFLFCPMAIAGLICPIAHDEFNIVSHITEKPNQYIGMVVKDDSEEEHLLVGAFLGGGHARLFQTAELFVGDFYKVLWAGELELQKKSQKIQILKANRTSGFVQNEINGGPFSKMGYEFENKSSALLRVAEKMGWKTDLKASEIIYDPENEHLIGELSVFDKNLRHDLNVALQFSSLIMGHAKSYPGVPYIIIDPETKLKMIMEEIPILARVFIETNTEWLSTDERNDLEAFQKILQTRPSDLINPAVDPRFAAEAERLILTVSRLFARGSKDGYSLITK